jgi:hypothetical protein
MKRPLPTRHKANRKRRGHAQCGNLSHGLRVSVDEDSTSLKKHYTGRLTRTDS